MDVGIREVLLAVALPCLLSCGKQGGATAVECGRPGSTCSGSFAGRTYSVFVPASFQPGSGALVIALHPLGSSGENMAALTGLNAKADEAGFAVAYPDAIGHLDGLASWTKYHQPGPDDIGFLREMIGRLQSSLQLDPRRIYATGYSDGAAMVHRVGAELGDLVAAIASVEGTLFYEFSYDLAAGLSAVPPAVAPVSVLMIQGDYEPENSMPYCRDHPIMANQETTFDYWAGPEANDCTTSSSAQRLCDGPLPTTLTSKTASGCRGGAEVTIYRVRSAPHGFWNRPGRWSTRLDASGGAGNQPDWDDATGTTTNDVLWAFFAGHPKP